MPQITVYPALVIGLGEGGGSICRAARSQLVESYPALLHMVHFIHVGPSGWGALDAEGATSSAEDAEEPEVRGRQEWFAHFAADEGFNQGYNTFLQTIQQQVLSENNQRAALQEGYNVPQPVPYMEIYIALSLGEDLGAGALFPTLSMIRKYREHERQALTVVALVDLSSARVVGDLGVGIRKLAVGLAELNAAMAGLIDVGQDKLKVVPHPFSTEQRLPTACILGDLRNANGFYLESSSDVQAALGQFLASWVACDVRGTRETLYGPLMGLAPVALTRGEGVSVCRIVGSFSEVLPVRAVNRYCSLRLAGEVLEQEFLTEDAIDEAATKAHVSQFIVTSELDEGRVLADLRELSPLPSLIDHLDPANFEEDRVSRDDLVDRLLSFDSFLGTTRLPRYIDKIKANASQKQEKITNRLEQHIDELVTAEPTGFRSSLAFLERLRLDLEERLIHPREQVWIPEIRPYADDLKESIDDCPNRTALLIKCGLVLVLLVHTLFGTDLISQHFEQGFLVSLLILAGLILVLGATAFSIVWIGDGRVQKAQRAFINEGLFEKYDSILLFTAREEYLGIIRALIDRVEVLLQEDSPLRRLGQELEEAERIVQSEVESSYYASAGSFEEVLFEKDDYGRLYNRRQVDPGGVAAALLREGHLDAWRTVEAETVIQAISGLGQREYERELSKLTIEDELQQKLSDSERLVDVYEGLRRKSVPLLHYATGAYTRGETAHELLLVGDAEQSIFAESIGDDGLVELVSTASNHRITCLRIIRDVAIPDVDAWQAEDESPGKSDRDDLERLHLVDDWQSLYKV